jgi:hypothetical protein
LPNFALVQINKAKGAFVSESALHSFDGDKPNSVWSPWRRDDHSSHPDFSEYPANFHSPWCDDTRGFLADRLPFLCFVLHRMGFFVPRELLRER